MKAPPCYRLLDLSPNLLTDIYEVLPDSAAKEAWRSTCLRMRYVQSVEEGDTVLRRHPRTPESQVFVDLPVWRQGRKIQIIISFRNWAKKLQLRKYATDGNGTGRIWRSERGSMRDAQDILEQILGRATNENSGISLMHNAPWMTAECHTYCNFKVASCTAMSTIAELHDRIWKWEARKNNFQNKQDKLQSTTPPHCHSRCCPSQSMRSRPPIQQHIGE